MALSSELFTKPGPGKDALDLCSRDHRGHFYQGMPSSAAVKDAVARIQQALAKLGFPTTDAPGVYGKSTADQVEKYKGPPRNILGPGQKKPDRIVGIQTIHSLDREVGGGKPSPGPQPVEQGSTNWSFSFFGHARAIGANEWAIMIISTEPNIRDGMRFTIAENFFQPTVIGPQLMTGFKGTANGTFTTPRKVMASEFKSAAAELRVFKMMFSNIVEGSLRLGTIGPVERQFSATLPIVLRDQTLKSEVTSGAFHMDGSLRA
jgi:hypothetical protein